MCQEVKRPLGLVWAVPEVNRAIRVIGEEAPKGLPLPLPLRFVLVTVVKGAFSTASCSTAISVSGDSFWSKLGP